MNRVFFALCSLILIFTSCQKENSFELPVKAQGSLQSDAGDCLPHTVRGTFSVGRALTDSDYIEVTIDVIKPGAYTVITDTINNYYFKATGIFNKVGSSVVRLRGFGTPSADGLDNFSVIFDSSFCNIQIPVTTGGTSGGTAVYNLNGAPGNCMNATVSGNYAVGTATTATHRVVINVNVVTPGTWSITTPSSGGLSFSGSGSFTTPGPQTITLTASGTPNSGGQQTFLVATGTSNCSFEVNVTGGTTPPPPTGVYFPLTANSYWTYDDGMGADTSKTINVGQVTLGSTAYQRFVTTYQSGIKNDTAHYRKTATNAYFRRIDTAGLGQYGLRFTTAAFDVEFLRDAMTLNQTLVTNVNVNFVAGPIGPPVPAQLRITSKCIETNASFTTTTTNKTINNIYVIETEIEVIISGISAGTVRSEVYAFARGIGLVAFSDASVDREIRYWNVN